MDREREAPQETGQLEGRYANHFQVGHNAFEFLLDFGQFDTERQTVQFHTRIITVPVYAKTLFELLRASIERYTQTFGVIPGEADVTDTGTQPSV
jgi:hypothetical protein